MSVRLEDLRPEVMYKAQRAIITMIADRISFSVRRTFSTAEEQRCYFLQGRATLEEANAARARAHMRPLLAKENGYTVTRCDGYKVKSNHQGGRALDIVPKDENGNPTWNYAKYAQEYRAIARVMKDAGFRCGADWPPIDKVTGLGWDPPHHEA